jgi:hypothetical protein
MKAFQEANSIINPMMDTFRLKDFISTYKRHTIRRALRPSNMNPKAFTQKAKDEMRSSAADYFFLFCRQVIPRIEERIELQLLNKVKSQLQSGPERRELE